MTKADCQVLANYWGIGELQRVETPETGTINTIRILTTVQGKFVLRVYRHQNHQRVAYEHRVVQWVAQQGVPAIEPLKTPDGNTFVQHQGQLATLLPFVLGTQYSRHTLQRSDVVTMGRFLGQLHQVLQKCPVDGIRPLQIAIEREATLAGIDRLEKRVRSIDTPDLVDAYALDRLCSRRVWLQERGEEDIRDFYTLPFQVLHGDYQETNLFFKHGDVSAIFDWDKIYTAPAGWEVVRALHLMLEFDLEKSLAFLEGYQEVQSMALEELDVVVHAYGLARAYDLWIYEEIYDVGNDRVRQFVKPGPFLPIKNTWLHIRDSLRGMMS